MTLSPLVISVRQDHPIAHILRLDSSIILAYICFVYNY